MYNLKVEKWNEVTKKFDFVFETQVEARYVEDLVMLICRTDAKYSTTSWNIEPTPSVVAQSF
jgi:hypothetical protein